MGRYRKLSRTNREAGRPGSGAAGAPVEALGVDARGDSDSRSGAGVVRRQFALAGERPGQIQDVASDSRDVSGRGSRPVVQAGGG